MKIFSNKIFAIKYIIRKPFCDSVKQTENVNPEQKTSLYVWTSNVSPGRRTDDYKNRYKLKLSPENIKFFNDKNPTFVYMGPRHSGVVTENGDLYTFGSGNWGVLGHGDETSVNAYDPKRVEYFKNNNIKIKKVCMGDYHTVALADNGDVYTWGYGGRKGFINLFFVGIIN